MRNKILIALMFLACTAGASVSDWIKVIPTPVRTVVVATVSQLKTAVTGATSGDLILVASGTYSVNDWLDFTGKQNIVIRGAGRATIIGQIRLCAHCWAINLEVTCPACVGGSLIEANQDDVNVINCILHDAPSGVNALLTGGGKSGGLFYGNICFKTRHVLYVQNASLSVPKYFVNNYFGDVLPGPDGNQYNIHAYTEQANNGYALKFYENVISNGKVLLGGQSNATPPQKAEFIGNWFFKSEFSGFKRPIEIQLKKNRFFRTMFHDEYWWGAGDAIYHPAPTVFQNNQFYDPENNFYAYVKTSRYLADGFRQDGGVAPLRPEDKFDKNRYFKHFKNSLEANHVFDAELGNIAIWRTKTNSAGNKFDVGGLFVPHLPPDAAILFPNLYDSGRSLLVVANWSGKGVQVTTDGDLYAIENPYGPAVYSGSDPVVTAPEVSVYLVR